MMNADDRRRTLLEKANRLPYSSGVYIMKDKNGRVIYVGKSRKLKSRVSQYFQNSEKSPKTARMVSLVHDFDYYLCDNEMEALSLENTLIKQYTPKYNIRLKDAKSYPYIKIPTVDFARPTFTRQRDSDKAKYFGPYSGVSTAIALIDLICSTLKLPTCKRSFPRDIGKGRPCINYQIDRCCGVCTGNITKEEYDTRIRYAFELLGGRVQKVKRSLEEQMYADAEAERYESAAKCRDTISALDRIGQKQKVVASPDTEEDVVALYTDDVCSSVSVFYVRSGVLQDKAEFLYGADSILEIEDMTTFLCEHYKSRMYIPQRILLAFPMEREDTEMLSSYLSGVAGHKVTVYTPERGTLRTLCEMVEKNAAEAAKRFQRDAEQTEGILAKLAGLLMLESYPSRIEAYDISNLGVEHLTGGMIVCEDGKFKRSDYRSFGIKTVEGNDDYASMREVLMRRLSHLSDESGSFSHAPDLILLDGGRGHVSTVCELLTQMHLDIPVFGMVKDDYHKTRALCTEHEEISIAREQDLFTFIYRIQEEVHRYTVGKMSGAKRKTLKTSVLTKISGIGDAKAKKLLSALGGLSAVKKATHEELCAISGISSRDADAVVAYFEQEAEQDRAKKKRGGKPT